MDSPEATVFNGPEPGHALTRREAAARLSRAIDRDGFALRLYAATSRRAAGCAGVGIPGRRHICIHPACATWTDIGDATDRATDHAWKILVPRLLHPENRRADAAFLAGLAVASRGIGEADNREEQLRNTIATLRKDHVGIPYLTPLSVLRIADAVAADNDDLPLIASEVGDSFDAALPLDHAEGAVKELRGDPVDRTRRARLRVLILARAFAAGLEAEDLRMIGQVCPLLGTTFASEDRDGLARFEASLALSPAATLATHRLGDDRVRLGALSKARRELFASAARSAVVPGFWWRRFGADPGMRRRRGLPRYERSPCPTRLSACGRGHWSAAAGSR